MPLFFVSMVTGMESGTLCMLGKHSTTKLHPSQQLGMFVDFGDFFDVGVIFLSVFLFCFPAITLAAVSSTLLATEVSSSALS